jgi:hypothetical protein
MTLAPKCSRYATQKFGFMSFNGSLPFRRGGPLREPSPQPFGYDTMISTRRFLARPASVLLLAIGLLSPWPAVDK